MVVPGRSWCTVVEEDLVVASAYGLLGPFAEGDYLRRVGVMVISDGVTSGRFGARLGISNEATQEAYESGASIIQRSMYSPGGIPEMRWYAVAGVPLWWWIPVGIVGDTGSRYLVFHYSMAGVQHKTMIVSTDVLRFKKGPKEAGQG